ncbi:dimethylargininase [Leifsonia shinshuensis]|uniref:Dimethylargininase n=1 Tax=Leifsonia shinshuensis TaxID=150026 RepID=A0A853CV90_9MICO|nr:dimethylargininase [Leifsonia shinshuensis]NYJ23114.1 dimethylargininase [Leifsonia shinshuensis]
MTSPWARRLVASLVSAVAVAAIGFVAATFVLMVANQLNAQALGNITTYLGWPALSAFVLSAIAALLGGYDRRWIAVVAGVLVGLVSTFIGEIVLFSTLNVTLSGAAWGQLFTLLISIELPFWLAVAVAFPTAGYAVFGAVEAQGGPTSRKIALVRIPAANLSEGLITHIEREAVDSELADKQWDDYVAALSAAGWQTVEVASADRLADSVFVEDTAVVFGDTAVISRPGADERKPEVAGTEAALRAQGLRLLRIEEPGTLDGGDVLKVGDTVYVGRGGRTNAEGIRQLRALVAPLGYTVVAVPVTKALHLKTAVTALPDGTVIGYEPLVDDPRIFERFLPVPEAHGTAVVVLDDETVLMSSSAPASVALVEDLGYTVIQVDISEFEKLEGCVTCLSIRIR